MIDTLIAYLYDKKQIQFFSLMHISAFSCFCSYTINRLCAALCSWLVTCFTFIRFIHIFRQFNTIKSNMIVLTALIIIVSIANSYSIIVLEYNPQRKYPINESLFINNSQQNMSSPLHHPFCTIRSEYANDRLMLLLNILVAGVLNLALPSILIIIVNITMLSFIKRIYSKQTRNKTSYRTDSSSYRSTRSTLVIISMTYASFYMPYVILYFFMIMLEDKDETFYAWSEIAYILRHVSHSVNFYAYIFTNLRFRREVALLCRFKCRRSIDSRQPIRLNPNKKTEILVLDKGRSPALYKNSIAKQIQRNQFYQSPNKMILQQQAAFLDEKNFI